MSHSLEQAVVVVVVAVAVLNAHHLAYPDAIKDVKLHAPLYVEEPVLPAAKASTATIVNNKQYTYEIKKERRIKITSRVLQKSGKISATYSWRCSFS